MQFLCLIAGLLLLLGVLLDAFQTVILPRRPTKRFRLTRLFFLLTWTPFAAMSDRINDHKRREQAFSYYGPLSLILLLVFWALILVVGFALMFFGMGSHFQDALNGSRSALANLRMDLYVSGTTIFTLGLGDVVPKEHLTRALMATESGAGLGFMAMVIGYVPVVYQAFSRREVSVALLDGRAGSPPTAMELVRRHGYDGGEVELIKLLAEWERWSAEILESHVSYPLLCYYRSQHDNQNWLAAMVAMLDACALLITTIEGETLRQAQLTFAMTRHALIDLGHVFGVAIKMDGADAAAEDRMPKEVFSRLCETLGDMEIRLCGDPAAMRRLTAIRKLYEPQAEAMSRYLRMTMPLWIPEEKKRDMWRTVQGLSAAGERALREEVPAPDAELQAVLAEGERALRANEHVSEQSTVTHLHED